MFCLQEDSNSYDIFYKRMTVHIEDLDLTSIKLVIVTIKHLRCVYFYCSFIVVHVRTYIYSLSYNIYHDNLWYVVQICASRFKIKSPELNDETSNQLQILF